MKGEQELKNMTVKSIDPQIIRRVKAQAALEGRRVGEVVQDALKAYLEKREKEKGEKEGGR